MSVIKKVWSSFPELIYLKYPFHIIWEANLHPCYLPPNVFEIYHAIAAKRKHLTLIWQDYRQNMLTEICDKLFTDWHVVLHLKASLSRQTWSYMASNLRLINGSINIKQKSVLYSTQVFVVVTAIISDSFYNSRVDLRPGLTKTVSWKNIQRNLEM